MTHFSQQQALPFPRFFQLGDVARNLGRADNRPARVPDRRNGQRNVDQAPVLALAHGLEVVDSLAAMDLLEDRRLFVLAVGRYNDGHWPADSLFGGKAEKPLGAAVPTQDQAVGILGQDGVVRRFHNGSVVLGGESLAPPFPAARIWRTRRGPLFGRLIRALQDRYLKANSDRV